VFSNYEVAIAGRAVVTWSSRLTSAREVPALNPRSLQFSILHEHHCDQSLF